MNRFQTLSNVAFDGFNLLSPYDMALPDCAPEDMRAAAQDEFNLVEGLVREAAQAKGDSRGRAPYTSSPPLSAALT